MKKRRDPFSFFANPYVVLADIMVSLVCIIALFLLSTTVYSEEVERVAAMQEKRDRLADSLVGQLKARGLAASRAEISADKYRIGDILEVESDGTLQRFRYGRARLDFVPGSEKFRDEGGAQRLLVVLGQALLQNRSSIKSIVIEGNAAPGEADPWRLSQKRAERVRQIWNQNGLLRPIPWSVRLEAVEFLRRLRLWDERRFHEWHREEYQARRVPLNQGLGVIPEAWIISSGRGDQARQEPVVEFKIEYTERDAPPLDEVLDGLEPAQRAQAEQQHLIDLKPSNPGQAR